MTLIRSERKQKAQPLFLWTILYLFAYMALTFLPQIKYSVPYIFAGVFCLIPLVMIGWKSSKYGAILLVLLLWGAVQGGVAYFLDNAPVSELINEPIRALRFFVPCALFEFFSQAPRKQQKLVWFFTTALLAYVVWQTLIALQNNSMIARELASGSVTSYLTSFRMQNIGGFGLCYAVGLMSSVCVYFVLRAQMIVRIVAAAAFLFIVYFSFQAQYMTMLLLCILSIVVILFICSTKIWSKVLIVLIAALSLVLLPTLFRFIAELDIGSNLQTKFIDMADAMTGSGVLADTTSRFDLYSNALYDFINSPLWGTPASEAAVRGHSTFLTTAASTGLIGLLFVVYCYRLYYRTTVQSLQRLQVNTRPFSAFFVLLLFLALVNPLQYVYEVSAVAFFYLPLTLSLWGTPPVSETDESFFS